MTVSSGAPIGSMMMKRVTNARANILLQHDRRNRVSVLAGPFSAYAAARKGPLTRVPPDAWQSSCA